jgi:N-acetylglucosamine-6-phosphate deacetylase
MVWFHLDTGKSGIGNSMKVRAIQNATILTPDKVIQNGTVHIDENGRFSHIVPSNSSQTVEPVDGDTLDATGLVLAPGYIDLQINGAFGLDFTHQPESIWQVAKKLPQYGVTSFLPTVITAPLSTYQQAQDVLRQGPPTDFDGANPLGLHCEGPFLNPEKKGAHPPAYLQLPDLSLVPDWSPENGVRLVTIAPELTGATAVIEELSRRGIIVSAGHSTATYDQACAGFKAGIRYGTHLFNAMSPLHHREPGLPGALLDDDHTIIGVIVDGIHFHPGLLRLIWAKAGGRLNLVSDAMAALGMEEGSYTLGGQQVTVKNGIAALANGTLAGSLLSLDQAVINLMQFTGCSLAEAVWSVTATPAALLALNKGRIAPGYDADMVLLLPNGQVNKTFVGGDLVFDGHPLMLNYK